MSSLVYIIKYTFIFLYIEILILILLNDDKIVDLLFQEDGLEVEYIRYDMTKKYYTDKQASLIKFKNADRIYIVNDSLNVSVEDRLSMFFNCGNYYICIPNKCFRVTKILQ